MVFSPKPKTKETTKIFTITNTTNIRLRCTIEMDSNELYSNSRFTFMFVPESFFLEKVQIAAAIVRRTELVVLVVVEHARFTHES